MTTENEDWQGDDVVDFGGSKPDDGELDYDAHGGRYVLAVDFLRDDRRFYHSNLVTHSDSAK